jgi:hypothetical protein
MNRLELFCLWLVLGVCLVLHLALQSVRQHAANMSISGHRQHSLPVQLMLAAVGLVIMAITGAWLLPGIPLVILIKLLHDHPAPLIWLQVGVCCCCAAACEPCQSSHHIQILSSSLSHKLSDSASQRLSACFAPIHCQVNPLLQG